MLVDIVDVGSSSLLQLLPGASSRSLDVALAASGTINGGSAGTTVSPSHAVAAQDEGVDHVVVAARSRGIGAWHGVVEEEGYEGSSPPPMPGGCWTVFVVVNSLVSGAAMAREERTARATKRREGCNETIPMLGV